MESYPHNNAIDHQIKKLGTICKEDSTITIGEKIDKIKSKKSSSIKLPPAFDYRHASSCDLIKKQHHPTFAPRRHVPRIPACDCGADMRRKDDMMMAKSFQAFKESIKDIYQ